MTTPEQAFKAALIRLIIANQHHISTKGFGRTPGMKCLRAFWLTGRRSRQWRLLRNCSKASWR